MAIVQSNYFNLAALDDHIADGGVLKTASVGLFTNQIAPDNTTTLTDLTEVTFVGYARQSVTWDSVYNGQDGAVHLNSQLVQFLASGNTTPNTVYGYFVVASDVSGTPLLFCETFDEPISFAADLDSLLISIQYTVGGRDNGDATLIS